MEKTNKVKFILLLLSISLINSIWIILYRFYPLQLSGHDIEWLWPFAQSWHWFEKPCTQLFFHCLIPFFKLNPLPYYMSGFILHMLIAILIFLLLKQISKNNSIAFIASIIFSIHYINTGVNLNIDHIAEKLSLIFFLMSFLSLIKFLNSNSIKSYIFSLSFFIVGLFCKESIYCFPFVSLSYIWIYHKKKNLTKYSYPFFLIIFIHLMIILTVFPNTGGYAEDIKATLQNVKGLAIKFLILVQMLFIPFDFQNNTLDFGFIYYHSLKLSLAVLILFLCMFILIHNKHYRFTFAWIFFTALPFLFARPDVILEKYLYFPLLPGSFLVSLIIHNKLLKPSQFKSLIFILICSLLCYSSYTRYIARYEVTKLVHRILVKEKKILSSYPKKLTLHYINFPTHINRIEAFTPQGSRSLDYWFLKDKDYEESNASLETLESYYEILNYCKNSTFPSHKKEVFLLYQSGQIIDITQLICKKRLE